MEMASATAQYRWTFFRAGGFDQVRLESGEDIRSLDQLDQKLWAALSCPTRGLYFDEKTLDLIDTDKDGRIRVREIIAATQWVCGMIKNADELLLEAKSLPLASINDATPEGRQILASARQILANLGKPEAASISVEDTNDTVRIFAQTRFNGDGVVPADAASDAFAALVLTAIISLLGGVTDRSGKQGVDAAKLATFFKDLQAYADWYALAEARPQEIWPMGQQATAEAYVAYDAVDAKIDDYFARCRLAAYDPRAQLALNRQETEYLLIAAKDLTITADEVAGFPLARVGADKPLPLAADLNPAWVGPMASFVRVVVKPIHGEIAELTESQWFAIKAYFSGYSAWQAAKQGASVEKLGLERVREILASTVKADIETLIAQDKALEPEANAIVTVDKLVRYYRDLHRLLINFVNFRDFYDNDEEMAIFQAGTLYLDQRSCNLCVRVEDMARHGTLAPLSRIYLAYCDCVREGGKEKMTIVAAFTAGDSDNLMVGRNGVFYDRKGQDWDATIVKVSENPISIAQAFWSPYKRMMRWVEEQIAKKAAAADTAATETLTGAAGHALDSAATGQPPKIKPKIDIGTVAALGVAVGGITAALGALLQAFFGLGWYMPLGVVGLILLISGPSMVIAWLKLRQRNLGPLLDAGGWAINTHAKINITFGETLTSSAKLPAGSKRDLRDRYADSHQGRYWTALTLLVIAVAWGLWNFGVLNRAFPNAGIPKSVWYEEYEKRQLESLQQKQGQEKCQANLKLIYAALTKYAQGHGGNYPADFGQLITEGLMPVGQVICPASGTQSPAEAEKAVDKAQWALVNSSYVYMGKGLTTQSNPKYVLIHDKPVNHKDGVHVLGVDGQIEFLTLSKLDARLAEARKLGQ